MTFFQNWSPLWILNTWFLIRIPAPNADEEPGLRIDVIWICNPRYTTTANEASILYAKIAPNIFNECGLDLQVNKGYRARRHFAKLEFVCFLSSRIIVCTHLSRILLQLVNMSASTVFWWCFGSAVLDPEIYHKNAESDQPFEIHRKFCISLFSFFKSFLFYIIKIRLPTADTDPDPDPGEPNQCGSGNCEKCIYWWVHVGVSAPLYAASACGHESGLELLLHSTPLTDTHSNTPTHVHHNKLGMDYYWKGISNKVIIAVLRICVYWMLRSGSRLDPGSLGRIQVESWLFRTDPGCILVL